MLHPARGRRRGHGTHWDHRHGRADGEIDQHRAGKIQGREQVKVGGEAKMVGDASRHQPADQIAGDIAGDIGRERAARIHRAALLAEIGERQSEGRRHAEPLHDAQNGERGEIRSNREQRRRNRQHAETGENAQPPVDIVQSPLHPKSTIVGCIYLRAC